MAREFVRAGVKVATDVREYGTLQIFIFQINSAPVVINAPAGKVFTQGIGIIETVAAELVEGRIGVWRAFFVCGQGKGPLPHTHFRPGQTCNRQNGKKIRGTSH